MLLKIDRVEVFGVAMPLVDTFTSGGVAKSTTKCVVVRLHASDGRAIWKAWRGCGARAASR